MRLYDRFTDRGFHTSIVTTFGVDFDVYENAVLTRLKGSGCYNNIIIADERMLTLALEDGYTLPKSAGKDYTVLGRKPVHGVFHPKIILQLGRQEAQLIIGSANMTAPGIAGNVEIVGHLTCGYEDTSERRLISSAWKYVSRFLREDPRSSEQLNWILERTPWLEESTQTASIETLADGTAAAFIGSSQDESIFSRFIANLNGENVNRLIVVSPYWDQDLSVMQELVETLSPEESIILIESGRGLFPAEKLPPKIKLIDLQNFKSGRFIHAKCLIVETPAADHILYGSANCTFAALGKKSHAGNNEEACFYRRLPASTILSTLSLEDLVLNAPPLQASEISPFVLRENIDLKEAGKMFPGRFELQYNILTWYPPPSANTLNAEIILLDEKGNSIATQTELIGSAEGIISYRISDNGEQISFARIIFSDGSVSAPGVVLCLEQLREKALREGRTKQAAKILDRLSEDEEDVLFDLAEIFDLLENDAAKQNRELITKRAPKDKNDNSGAPTREYKMLSYADFIASRQIQPSSGPLLRSNSLQGTNLLDINGFLSRHLAMPFENTDNVSPDEQDLIIAMGTSEDDLPEFGNKNLDTTQQSPLVTKPASAKKQRAHRESFAETVQIFTDKIEGKSKIAPLSGADLLRLRIILTVAAALGWCTNGGKIKKTDKGASWPRTAGKILFCFFGGKTPLIGQLQILDNYNSVPKDYIECWATCIWLSHACAVRARAEDEAELVTANLRQITNNIYLLIGLQKDDLLSPAVTDLLVGMDRRYCRRLNIEDGLIIRMHQEMTTHLAAK